MPVHLAKPLPNNPEPATASPEQQGRPMPWWELAILGMLTVFLLYEVGHQFHRAVLVQQNGEAAQQCRWAAADAARTAHQAEHPDYRFYGVTLAVDRTEANDGSFWREATPTFHCMVGVEGEREFLGARVEGEPLLDYTEMVTMTGFPEAATADQPLPSTVREVPQDH